MQYITGYNLTNQLDVQLQTSGTERRYEKVYERPIKLYKEVYCSCEKPRSKETICRRDKL